MNLAVFYEPQLYLHLPVYLSLVRCRTPNVSVCSTAMHSAVCIKRCDALVNAIILRGS